MDSYRKIVMSNGKSEFYAMNLIKSFVETKCTANDWYCGDKIEAANQLFLNTIIVNKEGTSLLENILM